VNVKVRKTESNKCEKYVLFSTKDHDGKREKKRRKSKIKELKKTKQNQATFFIALINMNQIK